MKAKQLSYLDLNLTDAERYTRQQYFDKVFWCHALLNDGTWSNMIEYHYKERPDMINNVVFAPPYDVDSE